MKDKTYLRGLLEYNTWANTQLYAGANELPPAEVTKQRKTLLESIHLSLNHLLAVDRIWLAHMQVTKHGIDELRAQLYDKFEELWSARRDMDGVLLAYLDSLDGEALEEVVGNTLKKCRVTLATAESCTGGLLGHRITQVSGSSEYYLGGVISYNEDAKINGLAGSFVSIKSSLYVRLYCIIIK